MIRRFICWTVGCKWRKRYILTVHSRNCFGDITCADYAYERSPFCLRCGKDIHYAADGK